jgi:HK97 family phage major capsid protein
MAFEFEMGKPLSPGKPLPYREAKRLRAEVSGKIETVLAKAGQESRALSDADCRELVALRGDAETLDTVIHQTEARNTIHQYDPVALLSGRLVRPGEADSDDAPAMSIIAPAREHHQATALKRNFAGWARRAAGGLIGLGELPTMEATAPSGVISVGSGSGLDSVNFAVPTQILPFMRSYLQFAPFERAGASLIDTDHMRNINLPVLAAGAPPSQYAEGAGPGSTSSPMGLSGFTFGANKYSRQVIASWESLQSTEVPLQPMIIDELLAATANVTTQASTTKLFNALTAPPGVTITGGAPAPLQIGGSGTSATIQADVYGQVTALRHSLPDGLEAPTNAFMLSRATLAIIRNTRASTSGVPMFDPDSDTILGRPYFVNEFFDSICGAGFITYGNWNKGAWLRRTPVVTRVLQELYWQNNEIGFIATQWTDAHFLAELVGASQPPTWQPLYFTVLPSGSLQ